MRIDGSGTLRASCLLCPNPGPMTLDGTNTWMLREPGSRGVIVVDPGPHDERHLERVARTVQEQGAQVAVILLTHAHADHSDGARYFSELTGAPVRAVDPEQRIGGDGLADGEVIDVDGLELRVLATPGHTTDSVCFYLPDDDVVLTGDTVLGRGTTVVADDNGLGRYLDSLVRLRDLVREAEIRALLPGHGPIVTEPLDLLTSYLDHRAERLEQITEAVAAGARTPAEIVARVYAGGDAAVLSAAESSVRAQLRYLAKRGDIPGDLAP
ncbi:MBL fold metallo-hydrolase [Marinitenerispora sediminis]|uniref:MBL fold metallo-hydrolase n=1 Tax=Marinitenerispora sediminis TaxID=1931232 RepID=A0A368T4M4_9ACTN|nr:MBL fold metallo-hydrolase [Marinitenerispora sediminis]RCV49847.1 MBL fold metallo-hydrolase [Marinitenerispora sediminis]RCV53908.1 MBL fold metallo-hydrolase [Marinitenerispora sediminis]RCV58380.1 MBL fold metallo-hydrolase [Marinitenerispora sediminis]